MTFKSLLELNTDLSRQHCVNLQVFDFKSALKSSLFISKEDAVLLEIIARRHDNTYLDELFVKSPVFYLDLDFNFQMPPLFLLAPMYHENILFLKH